MKIVEIFIQISLNFIPSSTINNPALVRIKTIWTSDGLTYWRKYA